MLVIDYSAIGCPLALLRFKNQLARVGINKIDEVQILLGRDMKNNQKDFQEFADITGQFLYKKTEDGLILRKPE